MLLIVTVSGPLTQKEKLNVLLNFINAAHASVLIDIITTCCIVISKHFKSHREARIHSCVF